MAAVGLSVSDIDCRESLLRHQAAITEDFDSSSSSPPSSDDAADGRPDGVGYGGAFSWHPECRIGMTSTAMERCASSTSSTPPESPSLRPPGGCAAGQRYRLLLEGDVQLCRLNHTRTVVSKIMNSKYLRRWEGHHLVLGSSEITSSTVSRCDWLKYVSLLSILSVDKFLD